MTGEKMTYQSRQGGTHRFIKALAFSALLAASGLGASAAFASPINVNTATQTELESIKGIGPSKAKTIFHYASHDGHCC
jgi:DNA uptake protein ComE-like DNA-binding protein